MRAAQRVAWLCVLSLIASCSGRSGSNHPPVGSTRGTLTVSWSAPTQNVDGTPVTELTGYTIYYGRGSKAYETSLSIDDPFGHSGRHPRAAAGCRLLLCNRRPQRGGRTQPGFPRGAWKGTSRIG